MKCEMKAYLNVRVKMQDGIELATDTEYCTFEQTVYHSKKYPSRIILPVINDKNK